jgi:hypothetical protein
VQLTLQNLLDKRQIQAAESGFGFRQLFHDRQDIPVETGEAVGLADYEHVGLAELIGELREFRPITNDIVRDIERESSADLGPRRFAQVKELLLRVWQSDRMI